MKKEDKLIIAIDFDNTICDFKSGMYPQIGKPLKLAIFTLNELIENGHSLVLNTIRQGDGLKIAEKCFKIKAEFDELEKNVEAERGKMRAKANRKTGRGEL